MKNTASRCATTGCNEGLHSQKWLCNLKANRWLLTMVVPAIVLLIVFVYVPMAGNVVAFKDFSFRKGIFGSDWVGFKNFERLWQMRPFWNAFQNQLTISFFMLITGFPVPIILALLLNEVRRSKIKRFFQTSYTVPYFLSWIVVAGIITSMLADRGIINQLMMALGGDKQKILRDGDQFRVMLYVTEIWKSAGWNSILYMAALAGINPELYEAASLDGANRWQQMLHITWPGLASTAAVLLVLSAGSVMQGGFDQILNLYNVMVQSKADIIDTFIYREFISKGMEFPLAAAVGLFKAVVNIALLVSVNFFVKKMGQEGVL